MALPGPSGIRSTRGRRDEGRGEDVDGSVEGWAPPNATNLYHRVDFRRPWVPSPEMPPAPLPDAPLPGIEEDEGEHEDGHEHEHEHGYEHPLGPRRAPRTRSSRAYVLYAYGGEENQNLANVNPNPNPSPNFHAPTRSASGSTGSTRVSVHTHTHAHTGQCKRPLRLSTGTLSGNGAGAGAGVAAYAAYNAQQAHATHPVDGDATVNDLPVRVPRVRQAPTSTTASASARPCARPRPPAREQERDQGDSASLTLTPVRRKSWLSVLSPKKLFSSPRKRRSVHAAPETDAGLGRSYLQDTNSNTNESNETEHASASAVANANTEILGRTHAAHVQVQAQVQARKREVHPAEWRAYGMWARPWLGKEYGDMVVRNATPPNPPIELSPPEVEAMFATLWEDDRPHPDRWIPRVQHPSLPPRPDLWPTPRQTYNPLPEELQLNPFLAHCLLGRPPLHFDLRLRVEDITLGERPPALSPYTLPPPPNNDPPPWIVEMAAAAAAAAAAAMGNPEDTPRAPNAFWCDGPNGAQPATYPGVPRLRIAALAGDAQHAFAWPVTVLPHDPSGRLPVLVGDVLHALVANFEARLARAELDALSDGRRTMVYQAYWRRMRLPVGGRVPEDTDGLRRVDYLGDATYFRGLAPDPGGDGFVLFLGPPP